MKKNLITKMMNIMEKNVIFNAIHTLKSNIILNAIEMYLTPNAKIINIGIVSMKMKRFFPEEICNIKDGKCDKDGDYMNFIQNLKAKELKMDEQEFNKKLDEWQE